MRPGSSGRADDLERAGPDTASVSRGPSFTSPSGHTKTYEEKQSMSNETNDGGAMATAVEAFFTDPVPLSGLAGQNNDDAAVEGTGGGG